MTELLSAYVNWGESHPVLFWVSYAGQFALVVWLGVRASVRLAGFFPTST